MKKIVCIISIFLLALTFTACNTNSSTDTNKEMVFEQLEWANYDNAKQIPIPKSDMAHIVNKNSVRYEFYLANTTFEDYKDYIDACKTKGFTLDVSEQEMRYHAFNADKYELTVQYQNNDIMYIEVVEKRYDIDIKILHANETSSDMYDLSIEIDDIWEEDLEKGSDVVSFDSYLKEGKHTLIIENDDNDNINGRFNFTVNSDTEYLEVYINCLNNKIEISDKPIVTATEPTTTAHTTTVETTSSTTKPTTTISNRTTKTYTTKPHSKYYTTSNDSYSSARHSDIDAWVCAQKIVRDRLKSPSSSKFCSMNEATITHLGSGKYKVTGWVDAQNSYGAVIRERFVVTYIALPEGFKDASVSFS